MSGEQRLNTHDPLEQTSDCRSAVRAPAPAPAARVPAVRGQKRRQCAGCHVCCGVGLRLNDPDIVLRRGERCPHVCQAGCALWGSGMPQLCRDYTCQYLVEDAPLTTAERPDELGALLQRRGAADVLMAEWRAGGLQRLVRNDIWGPMIHHHLALGTVFAVAFADDPEEAEALHVCRRDGELVCELASCDQDGKPLRVRVEPVYGAEQFTTLFVPEQDFCFPARLLIACLGDRPHLVLSPSRETEWTLHFRITRRQVGFLRVLVDLLQRAPAAW
jgi:hypothetical protein